MFIDTGDPVTHINHLSFTGAFAKADPKFSQPGDYYYELM